MEVKIKKLNENAVIPKYANSTDAGLDLTAVSKIYDKDGNVSYGTGISVEIPEGYMGLIFPRSSISKQDLSLSNSVGIIDSGYRGEIMLKFKPTLIHADDSYGEGVDLDTFDNLQIPGLDGYEYKNYSTGDRIGQLIIMPYPRIEFKEVKQLSSTERGDGGYGSTGN